MRRRRRGGVLAVVAVLVAPVLLLGPVGSGQESSEDDFVVGSGRADARVLRFGPSSAQLGLTPSVSLALADFVGSLGRAESRPFDWAALEDSVPEEFKDHYSSVRVEAREESEVSEEKSNWPFEQQARADDTPRGESTTRVLDMEIPGVLRISGGRASAFAGLTTVDGERFREAGGVAVIDEIEFFGGEGVLRGLHWELTQRTDAENETTYDGSFVIGEGVVGGETFEGPLGPGEAEPLLSALNEAFAPLGLRILAPEVDRGGGNSVTLSPLRISIADSEVGNQLGSPLVDAFDQEIRPVLLDPFLEECEDCASFVLIGDVTIGVLTGAGRFDLELGGVFGTTEGERFEDPFAGEFETPDLGDDSRVIEEVVEVAPARSSAGQEPPIETDDDEEETVAMQAPVRESAVPARGSSGPVESASQIWAGAVVAAAAAFGLTAAGYRRLRLRQLGLPIGG